MRQGFLTPGGLSDSSKIYRTHPKNLAFTPKSAGESIPRLIAKVG